MKIRNRALRAGAAFGVALLALTGCSTADTGGTSTQQEEPAAQTQAADAVTMEDAWVKAAEPGDMTAAFGTLENTSDADVTVVAVESSASQMMELHETVADDSGQMVMREVEGGFTIPANDHLHLEPGGNHLMLMELPEAIAAGEEVTFTLTFSDGSTLEFTAVAKDYAGANETYEGDMEHGDMHRDDAEHSEH
ncbi:MAG: copper chaperone PCu(A)C [Leucobacter sp.]